jgi:hypothetical protein
MENNGKDITGRPLFGFIFVFTYLCIFAGTAMIISAPEDLTASVSMSGEKLHIVSNTKEPVRHITVSYTQDFRAGTIPVNVVSFR